MAGGNLPDIEVTSEKRLPAIEQTVGSFSFHLDGGKMVTSNKMGRTINDEILNRWVKLGFIEGHRYVKSSQFTGSSEYQLTLGGHQEGDSSVFLQVISGLTLYTIPYYVDTQMDLVYSVRHEPTGCSFSASANDSYNTVVGLLMLPFSPFSQGGRNRTFDRIAKHLYRDLESAGAFGELEPCVAQEPMTHEAAKDPAEDAEAQKSIADRLEELADLRAKGLITQDEFEEKRKQLLDDL